MDSVEKGSEAGTYLVRIDILEQSKATPGVYDIELKDSKQPNVKNLARGDVVSFKGTADSYTATPNIVLTVVGEITQPDPLPDKPPVKEKPKPTPRHYAQDHTIGQSFQTKKLRSAEPKGWALRFFWQARVCANPCRDSFSFSRRAWRRSRSLIDHVWTLGNC